MKPTLSLFAVSLALLAGESAATGQIYSMKVTPTPVPAKGGATVRFIGSSTLCSYGIEVADATGQVVYKSPRHPNSGNYINFDFGPNGTKPGMHKLSVVNGNYYNQDLCALPLPAPIEFQVVPPPPPPAHVTPDMLLIRSMEPTDPMKNAKQPFPTGKFEYSLPTLKLPGCGVNVEVKGPEFVGRYRVKLIPGEPSSADKTQFELHTPGKYTLTMQTNTDYLNSMPEELHCTGMPISKTFEVVPKPFSNTTPGMSQSFNPITSPNPLVKPDAGKARP